MRPAQGRGPTPPEPTSGTRRVRAADTESHPAQPHPDPQDITAGQEVSRTSAREERLQRQGRAGGAQGGRTAAQPPGPHGSWGRDHRQPWTWAVGRLTPYPGLDSWGQGQGNTYKCRHVSESPRYCRASTVPRQASRGCGLPAASPTPASGRAERNTGGLSPQHPHLEHCSPQATPILMKGSDNGGSRAETRAICTIHSSLCLLAGRQDMLLPHAHTAPRELQGPVLSETRSHRRQTCMIHPRGVQPHQIHRQRAQQRQSRAVRAGGSQCAVGTGLHVVMGTV